MLERPHFRVPAAKVTMDQDAQNNSANGLPAGTAISHFRLIRQIGCGGMGEVYLAEDVHLHREVALKLLPSDKTSDPARRALLQREAEAAAILNHPSIVTVYEVGEHEGRPFFAMEYVKGTPLRDLIGTPQLTIERTVDIALQVLKGLSHAHNHGIIHRDIKPHNILLDEEGRAKICDFGLATVRRSADVTKTSATLGTIAYMSPEQIRGDALIPASDLFSFGIVLYQMLAGHLPFQGEYEASILYSIVNSEPEPLYNLRADLPPRVYLIVERLLEKDVAKRYQCASEVAADLGSLSEPSKLQTMLSLPLGRAARSPRGLVIAGVALVILLAIAGIAWKLLSVQRTPASHNKKMLAVLPFENLGAPQDEYFADGLTDAIITRLAKFGEIGVISRASVMSYKGAHTNLAQIGEELGADYIVTGTVYWDKASGEDRVRINAALAKASDNSSLWAESYDRARGSIFAIHSMIADDVLRSLNLATSESHALSSPTLSLQAYDFYLRGNDYFSRGWARNDIELAEKMYVQALSLDSAFALAWVMLSRAEASMYWEYYDRSGSRCDAAKEAVDHAMRIEPNLAEGHMALGYYYYHCQLDYVHALEQFDLALQQQPNNADLYNAVAAVERRQGNFAEALEHFRRSLELDPRSHLKAFDVALTAGLMRRFDEAYDHLDRALSLAPDWNLPYIYKAWLKILERGDAAGARKILDDAAQIPNVRLTSSQYYWWLYRILEPDYKATLQRVHMEDDSVSYYLYCAQLNRLLKRYDQEKVYADSARIILEPKVKKEPGAARYQSYIGLAYAGLRMKEKAISHSMRAIELLPTSRDSFDALFLLLNLAETYVAVGEMDKAEGQLQYLLSIPGFVSPSYLQLDPLWGPLRDRPGFQRMIAQGS